MLDVTNPEVAKFFTATLVWGLAGGMLAMASLVLIAIDSYTRNRDRLPDHLRDVPLGERGRLWEHQRDQVLGR